MKKPYQYLWNAVKTGLREKLLTVSTYIFKKKRSDLSWKKGKLNPKQEERKKNKNCRASNKIESMKFVTAF